ncbi:MAG: HAMP domain-containing sensor histidine kinase [Bacteroidota bacterium]
MKPTKLSPFWINLVGDTESFSREHRAFNAVNVLSLIVMSILLPINIYLGLNVVTITTTIVIGLLGIVYFLSRFEKNYKLGMMIFALASYGLLTITFFFNSGSKGPSIYLFFLSFQLIIAFSIIQRHLLWMIIHIIVITALLSIEYYIPDKIPYTYRSKYDQYLDLLTSGIAVVISMYFITMYLLDSYKIEKQNAEDRATMIAAQNEKLQKLNQEKTKILSILGHDLRSPLNSITTVLNFLTNYPLPEEHRLRLQRELLETTRNTSEMLANLLSWSSEQMHGIEPKLIQVNLLLVIHKVMEYQQLIADSKEIKINIHINDDIVVLADYNLLELTMRNIINNAIKFTPPMGAVTLSASIDENTCLIKVKDTGIGMNSEQMNSLFTMDIHSTYGTNNEKGIGLGLVLCKEFTEMQGGKIQVDSAEGKGSVFQLSMPLSKGQDLMSN